MLVIGTYTNKESKGLYKLEKNSIELFSPFSNPTYVVRDTDLYYTYSNTNDIVKMVVVDTDGIVVDACESNEKKAPCFIAKHSKLDYVITANYHEHKLVLYSRKQDKYSVIDSWQTTENESKLHHIFFSKDESLFFVCDLGLSKIYTFTVGDRLQCIDEISLPKGSGPRHMISDKYHRFYYVFTELSCEIYVFERINNKFVLKQVINTTKKKSLKSGAAVRISEDNRFLYVSNRIENSIVSFSIKKGLLSFNQRISSFGQHPRDFNLIENGLIVANRDSDNLVFMKRNLRDGKLSFDNSIVCFEPVSVCI